MAGKLDGKKVAILVADGFEQVEIQSRVRHSMKLAQKRKSFP